MFSKTDYSPGNKIQTTKPAHITSKHLPILIYCSSERTLNTHTHLFNPFLMYFPGDFWPPKNDSPCPPDENENCWFFRYIPKSKKWLNYHFRKHIWASSHRPVYEHLNVPRECNLCNMWFEGLHTTIADKSSTKA